MSNHPSAAPLRLGLDQRDARTSPGTSLAPDARRARQVWFAATLGAIAIVGLAVWQAARSDAAIPAAPAPVQPSPPAAPPAAASATPTMVITADEAAAIHPIALHVTSDPAGAGVFVNGKKLGVTPGDFEWAPADAHHDRPLLVQLRHPGYAPHTAKYAADTPRIDLDVTLQSRRAAVAPGAAPAGEGDTSAASAEATAEDDSESNPSEETESESESADPPEP